MQIKFYKKRVYWYYMYHNVEYRLESPEFIDAVANLFDKKELTITLQEGDSVLGLFVYFTPDFLVMYSGYLRIFAKLLDVNAYDFHFPFDVMPRCYVPYHIVNIE